LRILYITNSVNSSTCGIRDYVKLLTSSLERSGVKCSVTEFKNFLSSSLEKKHLPIADYYSMQFAPYGFSQTGLCGKDLTKIAKVLHNKRLHINFHEIWIGDYPSASWRERFIGWMQKNEILKFLDLAKPISITCSNSAAKDRLIQSGIQAKHLYLFGNVPYAPSENISVSSNLRVALFGTLYEKFPYNLLAEKLAQISATLKKPIEFRVIGRQRVNDGLHQIRNISKEWNFSLSETGELSTQSISIELQSCDLGLCTTPYDVLGKSGATAAMLEHGLPVIAFDDGDTPTEKLFVFEQFSDQVFLLEDHEFISRLLAFMQKKRKAFFDGVAHTTEEMLRILS